MAEDAFQRNGWPMLIDDVGHLNGQLKESVLEVKRRRQINHAHFYDFGVFIFSRENGVTGPFGSLGQFRAQLASQDHSLG